MWLIAICQMLVGVMSLPTSMGQNLVEEIEMQGFKIMTLQERYGNELTQWVYLDESVLNYNELRYLSVLHSGFDGYIYEGEIIVNEQIAEDVLAIFKELYAMRYPIEKMKVMSCYEGSDELSMMDNNSSGFNFREITDGGKLSKHAFGLAIDLNPRINPYIKSGVVLPSNGVQFVDRNQCIQGMIKQGDAVYQLFKRYGFTWGGDWTLLKDYQHFEK